LTPILVLAFVTVSASSVLAQEPPDSATLADSAAALAKQANSQYASGSVEALERALDLLVSPAGAEHQTGAARPAE
jgi:hypothetical protein